MSGANRKSSEEESVLAYKPDWAETQERYKKFWNREYNGRCILQVTAPRDLKEIPPAPLGPADVVERRNSRAFNKASTLHTLATTYYGADAFPIWEADGSGFMKICSCLGTKLEYTPTTTWNHSFIDAEDITSFDFTKLTLEGNEYWRMIVDWHRFYADQSKGLAIPGAAPIGQSGDNLAAMRGNQPLLLDIMDQPEYIIKFLDRLADIFISAYDELFAVLDGARRGSVSWYPVWSPGKTFPLSCDFAYMVSPAQFESVFLPSLVKVARRLDYNVFHLDGLFKHIDAICEIPGLRMLQIIPEPTHRWSEYRKELHRAQKKGVAIQLYLKPEEVASALEEFRADELLIFTKCATEKEARELIRMTERLSHA